jgi:para-aminobenzoate synthetase/4-amino-4-deoxychorismate lyase
MSLLSLPPRQALDFGPRPDASLGIFETVHVRDGTPVELDRHLQLLSSSAEELYGSRPPADLQYRIFAQASGHDGRLRVSLSPHGEVELERAPAGASRQYTSVAPFVLVGGLGPHKWTDRRLIDGLTGAAGDGVLALIVDSYGAVLEATWANVLIEERGELISPPHDGRFRSGVGARRFLFREEPVDLDRLLAADAVILTSALRTLRLG